MLQFSSMIWQIGKDLETGFHDGGDDIDYRSSAVQFIRLALDVWASPFPDYSEEEILKEYFGYDDPDKISGLKTRNGWMKSYIQNATEVISLTDIQLVFTEVKRYWNIDLFKYL